MNKKLLTLVTAWVISISCIDWVFWQEIASTLQWNKKIHETEIIKKEIIENLYENKINKKEYEQKRNFIINHQKNHREFKKLIKEYIKSIEQEVIQNPELRKRELEMLYFDCEFADISTPHKLKNLLNLSWSHVID